MKTRTMRPGEYVYHEGGESDAVYLVESGEIEVLKAAQDEQVLLAVLRRGDLFGEVGVIRGKPRGTTTRARVEAKLLVIDKPDFLAAFGGGNDIAMRVLHALCERLASADQQIVSRWTPPEAVREGQFRRIALLPASPTVARQIGSDGVAIEALPFRVGALESGTGTPRARENRLALHTHEKYQLANSHFAIELRDGLLVIADLGSHLGTMVNGVRISGFEHVSTAGLMPGDNLVVAGGLESPYRFTVRVS